MSKSDITLEQKVDRLLADVAEIKSFLSRMVQVRTAGGKLAVGVVRPPSDLGPAIAALSEEARAHMYALIGDRQPTTKDIAQAADWDQERQAA